VNGYGGFGNSNPVVFDIATGQVVNSLVHDIINPLIGVLLANVDLSNAKIVVGTVTGPDGKGCRKCAALRQLH
jgi:large-conductance mechanosensitive channel